MANMSRQKIRENSILHAQLANTAITSAAVLLFQFMKLKTKIIFFPFDIEEKIIVGCGQ